MKRKILAITLAAALTAAATGSMAADFTDVAKTSNYSDAVDYCVENGLMYGTSDTEFSPDENTSRAMLVTILYRHIGGNVSAPMTFTDVPAGSWYYDAVAWGMANGIVSGYDNEHFAPDDLLTREQIITILWRTDGEPNENASLSYSDISAISDYAKSAITWAAAHDIIENSGSALKPGENITRAEMAQLLYNYLGQDEIQPTQTPEPTAEPTATSTPALSTSDNNSEHLIITFGNNGTSFNAVLDENETTALLADFAGGSGINLPIYHFDDYEGWEYKQIYDIPSHYKIPATTQRVTEQKAGEIYFEPSTNRIVLYYQDAKDTAEYTKIATITETSGLSTAVTENPVLEGWGNKIISIRYGK